MDASAAQKAPQDAQPPAGAPTEPGGALRTVQVTSMATEAEAADLRLAAAIEGLGRGRWVLGVALERARTVIAGHMEQRAAEAMADDGA